MNRRDQIRMDERRRLSHAPKTYVPPYFSSDSPKSFMDNYVESRKILQSLAAKPELLSDMNDKKSFKIPKKPAPIQRGGVGMYGNIQFNNRPNDRNLREDLDEGNREYPNRRIIEEDRRLTNTYPPRRVSFDPRRGEPLNEEEMHFHMNEQEEHRRDEVMANGAGGGEGRIYRNAAHKRFLERQEKRMIKTHELEQRNREEYHHPREGSPHEVFDRNFNDNVGNFVIEKYDREQARGEIFDARPDRRPPMQRQENQPLRKGPEPLLRRKSPPRLVERAPNDFLTRKYEEGAGRKVEIIPKRAFNQNENFRKRRPNQSNNSPRRDLPPNKRSQNSQENAAPKSRFYLNQPVEIIISDRSDPSGKISPENTQILMNEIQESVAKRILSNPTYQTRFISHKHEGGLITVTCADEFTSVFLQQKLKETLPLWPGAQLKWCFGSFKSCFINFILPRSIEHLSEFRDNCKKTNSRLATEKWRMVEVQNADDDSGKLFKLAIDMQSFEIIKKQGMLVRCGNRTIKIKADEEANCPPKA